MSTLVSRIGARSLAVSAFIAAIIGAICTDAFLSIAGHESPIHLWQFIASTLVGPVAFTATSYAGLGLVMHLITASVWAYLYAYGWGKVSNLQNWLLGGIVWGIVVDVCMNILLTLRGVPFQASPGPIAMGLVTNVVFYGIPVGWYLSRSARNELA
jgi:hypothetical protein